MRKQLFNAACFKSSHLFPLSLFPSHMQHMFPHSLLFRTCCSYSYEKKSFLILLKEDTKDKVIWS